MYHHWSAPHFCLYHNVQLNLKPLRPLLLAMSLLLYFTQTTEPGSCNKSVALSSDAATAIDHHASQNKTKKLLSYSILSHSSIPINPPSTTILKLQNLTKNQPLIASKKATEQLGTEQNRTEHISPASRLLHTRITKLPNHASYRASNLNLPLSLRTPENRNSMSAFPKPNN